MIFTGKKNKKKGKRYGWLVPFANLSGWTCGRILKKVAKEPYLKYCI